MNLKFSFFLIVFTIVPIFCQTFSPKGFSNTENSITFDWDLNDPNYYTKWEITKADGNITEMSFQCTSNATIKSCTYTNNGTPPMNELYGLSGMPCFMDGSSEKCQGILQPSHYPTPIINSTIPSIPVDGTTITLVGSFIIFIVGNDSNYFQLLSGGIANFNSPIHLDPTQMIINIPSGCGQDSIKWPSGSKPLTFNYIAPTVIGNSTLSSDGNSLILNGLNFCNKSNSILSVYLGGVLQTDKVKIKSTSIELDVSQVLYCEVLNFSVIFGSNLKELKNEPITFSPILYNVNSVPAAIGGRITIKGMRLTTPPGTTPNITLGFESSWNINASTASYILCDLQPGYEKPTQLSVWVDNITSSNSISFNYNEISIVSSTQNANIITLYGDCFGSDNNTEILIDGKSSVIPLNIIDYETAIIFMIPGNYGGDTLVQVKAYGFTAEYNVPLQLYVTPSEGIFNSPHPTHFKFYFQYSDSINPKITIYNKTFDGDESSKELKDDGSSAYIFNDFPGICGDQPLQYEIGNQTYIDTVTSSKPSFANCTYSPETNITLCTGSYFGGSYFDNQVLIQFLNSTITPLNITDTEFTFITYDNYVSGHLTINSCGGSADTFYIINPIYFSNVAEGFHNNDPNDAVIVNGKFFSSSVVVSIKCGNQTFPKCNLIDYKTISCPVQLYGPDDQICDLNFENQTKLVYVSFQQPIALASNSLYLEGGELVIFGDSFYDRINNIHVGSVQCTNSKFISTSAISCTLPPITNKDLLNQIMFINITIADKSGGGYAFSYLTRWIEFDSSSNVDSMIIITTIIIAFAIGSIYIHFALIYYKKKNNGRVTLPSSAPRQVDQRRQLTRQLTQPQFIIPQQTSSSRSNSISRY
ncbi:hypothetical protein ACTFIY_003593 [Dictyostelium cf. discoideum]